VKSVLSFVLAACIGASLAGCYYNGGRGNTPTAATPNSNNVIWYAKICDFLVENYFVNPPTDPVKLAWDRDEEKWREVEIHEFIELALRDAADTLRYNLWNEATSEERKQMQKVAASTLKRIGDKQNPLTDILREHSQKRD